MQKLAVKKQISKSADSYQGVKSRLKKALVDAHGYGIIPGWVVEEIFKIAGLRGM